MKTFWFVLVWLIAFSFNSCNYRTPSNIRFEKATGIILTDSITVLQDRFEESGPDYGLFYEFKIKKKDCSDILDKINKSKDWKKTKSGWELQKTDDGIIYNVLFSKEDCKIIYREELI